ncbi:YodC family protein [Enterobacter hormaechei subsp. steigerwaltii]
MAQSPQQQKNPVYKIGDQVVIKSGGPVMTIEKPVRNIDQIFVGTYKCQWFAGKKLDTGTFPKASLEPYIPKP